MGRTALLTKTNIIAAIVAIGVAIPGAAILLNREAPQPKPAASQAVQEASTARAEIRPGSVGYAGQDGKDALELLKSYADVKTESSSYGEFVKAINGQDGAGKKYWTFYINGKMAQVGAGTYETKSTDKIEWKLQ